MEIITTSKLHLKICLLSMVAEMMPFTKPSLFKSFFIYKNICLSYITSGTKKKIPERKTNSITTGAESIFLN